MCVYIYIYIYIKETGRRLLTEEHVVRDIMQLCDFCQKHRGFSRKLKLGAGF